MHRKFLKWSKGTLGKLEHKFSWNYSNMSLKFRDFKNSVINNWWYFDRQLRFEIFQTYDSIFFFGNAFAPTRPAAGSNRKGWTIIYMDVPGVCSFLFSCKQFTRKTLKIKCWFWDMENSNDFNISKTWNFQYWKHERSYSVGKIDADNRPIVVTRLSKIQI